MKTLRHDTLVALAGEQLRAAVRGRWWVRQEASSNLDDTMSEPDVSVVAGTREDYEDAPATAALVVVAVISLAADREKAALYAEVGVGECRIVLAGAGQVEVHRRPQAGVYQERQTLGRGEAIGGVAVLGGAALAVDSLFA